MSKCVNSVSVSSADDAVLTVMHIGSYQHDSSAAIHCINSKGLSGAEGVNAKRIKTHSEDL